MAAGRAGLRCLPGPGGVRGVAEVEVELGLVPVPELSLASSSFIKELW